MAEPHEGRINRRVEKSILAATCANSATARDGTRRYCGEDPATMDTPERAAEFNVPMCAPAWDAMGKFYDFKTRTLMSFRAPA